MGCLKLGTILLFHSSFYSLIFGFVFLAILLYVYIVSYLYVSKKTSKGVTLRMVNLVFLIFTIYLLAVLGGIFGDLLAILTVLTYIGIVKASWKRIGTLRNLLIGRMVIGSVKREQTK